MERNVASMVLVALVVLFCTSGCGSSTSGDSGYPTSLPIVLRADWGWTPAEFEAERQVINRITIHHTGLERDPDEDIPAFLRGLLAWSRFVQGWSDLPYHFVVSRDGIVYEARPLEFVGDSQTEYDLFGHVHVALIGNYEVESVPELGLASLRELVEFLADVYGVEADRIGGHRDYTAATLCPGGHLHELIPSLGVPRGASPH